MLPELLKKSLSNKNSRNNYMTAHIEQLIGHLEQLEKVAGQEFTSLFKPFNYRKGHFLLREGEISRRIWILEEGITHCFTSNKGEDITSTFYFPGEFIDCYSSSTFKEKAYINFQLLTDASGLYMDWIDMEQLKTNYPIVTEIEKKIVACYVSNIEMREQRLRSLSAPEHYQFLLDNYPNYIQHLPVSFIASYLGISLGSLSRIRGNVPMLNLRNKKACQKV